MSRLSQSTVLLIAAMVVLSMAGTAVPAGAVEDVPEPRTADDAVQSLENDEDLYFVFGANLSDQSLEEFIETEMTEQPDPVTDRERVSNVVQYQDVDQVDFNRQGGAISISIDGGEATAVQEENQQNANSQVGEATAENTLSQSEELSFENVGDIHIVFGNGDSQAFNGWSIADGMDGGSQDVTRPTESATIQEQNVTQLNANGQSTAVAIAENKSEAVAYQRSTQVNQNLQQGSTSLLETGAGGTDSATSTESTVEQSQTVSQTNWNQQGLAVAIAVGNDSVATAVQITDQTNLNEQTAAAETVSLLDVMSGMNVATADAANSSVLTTDGDTEDDHDSGDAEVSVNQYQRIEQVNGNLQSAAVAIAINESNATAIQLAEQRNYNEQVGTASADDAPQNFSSDVGPVITNETTLTIGGDDAQGDSLISLDYGGENAQRTDGEQYTVAELKQVQFVSQENRNQQRAAIAVAKDNGSADASQITMQENRNVQFGEAEPTTVDATDNGADSEDADGDDDTADGEPAEDGTAHDGETKIGNGNATDGKTKKPDDVGDETADSDGTGDDTVTADEPEGTDDVSDETVDNDSQGDHTMTVDEPEGTDDAVDDESIPGFGVGAALVAVLAAAMIAARGEH